jgi:hypothetical protein
MVMMLMAGRLDIVARLHPPLLRPLLGRHRHQSESGCRRTVLPGRFTRIDSANQSSFWHFNRAEREYGRRQRQSVQA